MYELKKSGIDVPDDIIDEDECAQVLYDILTEEMPNQIEQDRFKTESLRQYFPRYYSAQQK